MKRKDYRKPTMKVVKLQHTQMLMTSGESSPSGKAGMQDYGWNDYQEE